MFEWKKEDCVLRTMSDKDILNYELQISYDDKLSFIDSLHEGIMGYILSLIEKYEQESPNLPVDKYGNVKTVSLKAWLRKNDTKYAMPVIDADYQYGKIRFLGMNRSIKNPNYKNPYDSYNNIVDEAFHRCMLKCKREEINYFAAHDPYTIKSAAVREYLEKYNTTFNLRISYGNEINVCDDDDNTRRLTLEELDVLIEKYKKMDILADEIAAELQKEKFLQD